MKVWTKVFIKDRDRQVELIAKALTNYIYECGPMRELSLKYNMTPNDKRLIDQFTANRVAGLLMLYLSKDVKRINDIANKYNVRNGIDSVIPEIEGYIDK